MNKDKKEKPSIVFSHHVPIQIRFNDVDRYGHVNNNVYFAYYDLGKDAYLRQVLCDDFRGQPIVPVIANIQADFLMPIFYGEEIVVETAISHLGTKSFVLQQQAINVKTQQVVCTCRTVMVCFSLKNQTTAEIPESYKKAILDFEAPGTVTIE